MSQMTNTCFRLVVCLFVLRASFLFILQNLTGCKYQVPPYVYLVLVPIDSFPSTSLHIKVSVTADPFYFHSRQLHSLIPMISFGGLVALYPPLWVIGCQGFSSS